MPTTPNQAKVRADIKNNLLLITVQGCVCKKRLEGVYTDLRFNVSDLQPGFIVINDLSCARIGHLSGIPILKKIMAYLVENKVGAVIRVVNDRSLIVKQLNRVVSALIGYTPIYVGSLEEAMVRAEAIRSGHQTDHSSPQAATG